MEAPQPCCQNQVHTHVATNFSLVLVVDHFYFWHLCCHRRLSFRRRLSGAETERNSISFTFRRSFVVAINRLWFCSSHNSSPSAIATSNPLHNFCACAALSTHMYHSTNVLCVCTTFTYTYELEHCATHLWRTCQCLRGVCCFHTWLTPIEYIRNIDDDRRLLLLLSPSIYVVHSTCKPHTNVINSSVLFGLPHEFAPILSLTSTIWLSLTCAFDTRHWHLRNIPTKRSIRRQRHLIVDIII